MALFEQPGQESDVKKSAILNYRLLSVLKSHAKETFDLAWKKKSGHVLVQKSKQEAQAFFDDLGIDGAKAMLAHSKEQELLILVSDWSPLIPPFLYVANQDGTVTIGDSRE